AAPATAVPEGEQRVEAEGKIVLRARRPGLVDGRDVDDRRFDFGHERRDVGRPRQKGRSCERRGRRGHGLGGRRGRWRRREPGGWMRRLCGRRRLPLARGDERKGYEKGGKSPIEERVRAHLT